jgi:hypothetical protein
VPAGTVTRSPKCGYRARSRAGCPPRTISRARPSHDPPHDPPPHVARGDRRSRRSLAAKRRPPSVRLLKTKEIIGFVCSLFSAGMAPQDPELGSFGVFVCSRIGVADPPRAFQSQKRSPAGSFSPCLSPRWQRGVSWVQVSKGIQAPGSLLARLIEPAYRHTPRLTLMTSLQSMFVSSADTSSWVACFWGVARSLKGCVPFWPFLPRPRSARSVPGHRSPTDLPFFPSSRGRSDAVSATPPPTPGRTPSAPTKVAAVPLYLPGKAKCFTSSCCPPIPNQLLLAAFQESQRVSA